MLNRAATEMYTPPAPSVMQDEPAGAGGRHVPPKELVPGGEGTRGAPRHRRAHGAQPQNRRPAGLGRIPIQASDALDIELHMPPFVKVQVRYHLRGLVTLVSEG